MLGSARDQAAPLLGRAREQSLLTSILDEVGEHGQALVLRGEPGIGNHVPGRAGRRAGEVVVRTRARESAVI